MRLPALVALAALATLSACKITEENYPEKVAKAQCDYLERCTASTFWYYYESGRDCEDEFMDRWEDYGSITYKDCDFNEEEAKACLDALDMSCRDVGEQYDDWDESCYAVYECSVPVGG